MPIIEIDACLIHEMQKNQCFFSQTNTDFFPQPSLYRVKAPDKLLISVWGQPELNKPSSPDLDDQPLYTVDQKGNIFFPFVGNIHVANKSIDSIREELVHAIKKVVRNPEVTINVAEFRSQFVNVIGEVNLPQIIPISDVPLTPLDAITLSGGVTEFGDLRHIILQSTDGVKEYNFIPTIGKSDKPFKYLEHGDVIYVPKRFNQQVYVLGEVIFPQSVVMESDVMTLSEAVSKVAGLNPFSSNAEQIFVFRENELGEKLAYHLNGSSPAALLLANNFILQKQDIIYVGTYKPALLNRIMMNFLSTSQVLQNCSRSARDINDIIQGRNN